MSSNQTVIDSLKKTLAHTYALYLKTHNYHWNITGMHFHALHGMFEEQYDDLFEAMDEIAERIRALGEKVPAHQDLAPLHSEITNADPNKSDKEMVLDLAKDNEHVIKSLLELSHAADEVDDEATEDLAIGRMSIHEKALWMLRSTAQ